MTTQTIPFCMDDIDPTVFIMMTDKLICFLGKYTMLLCQAKKNMIELDGPIMPISLPRFGEAWK